MVNEALRLEFVGVFSRVAPLTRYDDITRALRNLAPRIPRHDLKAVIDHALHSRGLKSANAETAAWLSLVAYVRHVYTDYETLLAGGYERDAVRFFVVGEINRVLASWGVCRAVSSEE